MTNPPCPPLNRADIAARSAAAQTAVERRRWQVIGMLADQTSLAEIAAATGYCPRTIRIILRRYLAAGAAGLVDGRSRSRGAAPVLSPALQRELRQAMQHPPPGGGHWTGPLVARWITARTGKLAHRQRGWEYLRRLAVVPPHGSSAPASGEGAAAAGE